MTPAGKGGLFKNPLHPPSILLMSEITAEVPEKLELLALLSSCPAGALPPARLPFTDFFLSARRAMQ